MTTHAYITDLAGFLPNAPVGNDEMEAILGMVDGKPSRTRKLILRNNGIQTRYYAIDRRTGHYTHTNAQLAAAAVRALLARSGLPAGEIDVLCCGTSSPDQIVPAHAHMVHGELHSPPCEVASTAGVCTSGITALKYAWLSVLAGQAARAVSCGSEFVSSVMRGSFFAPETEAQANALGEHPELAFEKDFLRWMLSDGAGAALIRNRPNPDRPSLRIDWIDCLSYANEMPVCMYAGAVKEADGRLKGWRENEDPQEILRQSVLALKQDARLLNDTIMPLSGRALRTLAAKHQLQPGDVTWFLPHYSSQYFRQRLHDAFAACGFAMPFERWFTNLTTKGNIGAASMYVILEELLYSGKLKAGDRLLCYIPESARFSICYMLLTVV